MTGISTEELYVVVYPNDSGYNYDTESPEIVYLSKEEAEIVADEFTKMHPSWFQNNKKYYVETLNIRLDTIKSEKYYEGNHTATSADY